ncbi:helix-turn-helix domain-containing protein [Muricauda sp. HICW]|uniref:Helix-turn-helix domain-containing protein n=1 Tax=Flagellimonas chongwuensis TaxID=2697365 RepID=A0A850NEZ9_9FLAO|nr:AraC family transcriptional regulator [Allomuricauda chongwuensis]NVN17500.1 helix-turn-helix domain-containing protein [Allomuricauda chongwuensis]
MSFWENTPLFTKSKIGLFTKRLFLLFSFLFFFSLLITIYSWSNVGYGFSSIMLYAQILQLIVYLVVIYLLFKNQKNIALKDSNLSTCDKKYKYEKTGLSESFSLELKNKLELLMNEEKLYLNHELRLDDIAELLDISRHHASQVINENFNLSFYDFVNSYRIEEAKNRLCSDFENTSESISDIAYQCGFNNRVSFYKAFKKVTQVTPKEFVHAAA